MRYPTAMREARSTKQSSALVRTTPVPNWILDEVMPTLSDTELRVLLVVVRATLGWKMGEGRKTSDWISHLQLQARTGRSSASVSRAVDSLVKRGMLFITNAQGEPLSTAAQRSQARGHIFYQLVRDVERQGSEVKHVDASPTIEIEASNNRKELQDALKSEGNVAISTIKTCPQKVRTTKEIWDKENEMRVADVSQGEVVKLPLPTSLNGMTRLCLDDAAPDASKTLTSEKMQNMDEFIRIFRNAYAAARPDDLIPSIDIRTQGLLEQRLHMFSVEELEAWLPGFFGCTFGYVRRRRWSLESYLESIQLIRARHATRS